VLVDPEVPLPEVPVPDVPDVPLPTPEVPVPLEEPLPSALEPLVPVPPLMELNLLNSSRLICPS